MSTGREGVPSVQEETESSGLLETEAEESTETTEESTDDIEYKAGESAQETAARLLKGEEESVPGDETSGDKEAETDPDRPVKQGKKKSSDEEDYDPELIAPARLNPVEAKMFQNLPKGLKRAFHRSIKNVEAQGTRTQQQAAQIVQKWGGFEEQIAPFAQDWADRGISVPAGLLQLASTQKKLTDANPEVREATYLKLAKQSHIDVVKLAKKLLGNTGQQGGSEAITDISSHPQFQELNNRFLSLQEQVNPVLSYHQQQQESQDNQVASQIVQEIETVRNEIDPSSGQYRYPEMFERDFLERAKPLVIALRRADPNLSWGDAYRRTHTAMTGRSSPQPATRLHASNGNNTASRATSAAVTVRGRSVPTIATTDTEPPPEILRRGAQATMEWLSQNVGRGG